MKNLKEYLRLARITLCVLTCFATAPAWATGGTMTGSGTAEDPFIIADAQDWATFAANIASDIDADKYYKLADDFDAFSSADNPVSEMVSGVFKGHFDGNGKTIFIKLDVYNDYDNNDEVEAALFSALSSATIENLNVKGDVYAYGEFNYGGCYVAGLVVHCYDNNSILNCHVATHMQMNHDFSCYLGGIVGDAQGTLTIDGCVYSGCISIATSDITCNAFAGGFVGTCRNTANIEMNNCLFKGSCDEPNEKGHFYPILAAGSERATLSNVYYLYTDQPIFGVPSQSADGIPVSETQDDLWDVPVVAVDGNTYYMLSDEAMKAIEFADPEVKRICVSWHNADSEWNPMNTGEDWSFNWDKNHDGELSVLEASQVQTFVECREYEDEFEVMNFEFCSVFKGSAIKSFDELKYFTNANLDHAFSDCKGLQSVVLPSNLTHLPNYIFSGCSSLTSVDLSALTSIGENAFGGCTKLASIDLSNCISIGNHAFQNCSSLTNVDLSNCTSIGDYAFSGCSNLISVDLSNCMSIGNHAFQGCSLTNVDLSNCTSIGDYAFSGCSSLTNIGDLSNCTYLGKGCFKDSGLRAITLQGTSVPTLGSSNDWGETIVLVPELLLSTYQSADNWKDIKNKIFAIGTQIEYDLAVTAQSNKSQLTSKIGAAKLGNVISLKLSGTINSYDIMLIRNKMPNLKYLDLTDVSIVANDYQYYTGYHSENDVLGPYSFFEVGNLRTVKLPKSIKSIGEHAFTSSGIREVLIPGDELESVDAGAFENCEYLAIVTFYDCPNAQIGNGAFQECRNLSKVIFSGDAPESIGYRAFYDIGNLAEVTFMGNAPTSIGDEAFQDDYGVYESCGLSKVTFMGNAPVSIGYYAFAYNPSLTVVTFTENSPVSIGEGAFAHCSGLKEISFPGNTLREIGSYAFNSCSSLPSLVIPEGVERIDNNAFQNCSGLREITLPQSLRDIGYSAFQSSGLTSLKLPIRLNSIGDYAFANCRNLRVLHIPSMITSIGDRAFEGCNNLLDVWTHHLVPQNIDQHTFSTYETATLHVIKSSFDNYFWNTQWSQFLDLVEFEYEDLDSEYDIYKEVWLINNNTDLTVDDDTGVIDDTEDAIGQIEEGSALICENESENQEVGTIELDVNDEAAATLIENGNLSVNQMQFNIAVNGGQWYFFSFPFRISLDNISCEGEWLFRYYDSDARARGESGWQDLPAGTGWLEPGMGYIFQCNEGGTLIVTVNQDDLTLGGGDTQQALTAHGGQEAENSSWNFLGNPYTSYFNVGNTGYECPVTVWNGYEYVTVEPGSDYYLRPFQAYFVQKPEDITEISFSADDRETFNQTQESAGAKTVFLMKAPEAQADNSAMTTVVERPNHRLMSAPRANTMSTTFNPANPPEPTGTQANVDMNMSVATAVTSVNTEEGNRTFYNAAGQRMNKSTRGLNIVRDQSGKTRKVVVK